MGHAEFESAPVAASDDIRIADAIRRSVREAVERALGKFAGTADTRKEARAVGEKLGKALVAHAAAAEPTGIPRRFQPSAAVDDADGRARAFRAMAGVRR